MQSFEEIANALETSQKCIHLVDEVNDPKDDPWEFIVRMPKAGDCVFGWPVNPMWNLGELKEIPKDATGFRFLLGPAQQELIDAFVRSSYPDQTELLSIGASENWNTNLNYTQLLSSLSTRKYPNLVSLELGIADPAMNFSLSIGQLGVLDELIQNCPQIRELTISGSWELRSQLDLSRLKHLSIRVPQCGDNPEVPPIDRLSIENLLHSRLPVDPRFVELCFHEPSDLKGSGFEPIWYQLPSEFLNWQPNMKEGIFFLSGCFEAGSKYRFEASNLAKTLSPEKRNEVLAGLFEENTQ